MNNCITKVAFIAGALVVCGCDLGVEKKLSGANVPGKYVYRENGKTEVLILDRSGTYSQRGNLGAGTLVFTNSGAWRENTNGVIFLSPYMDYFAGVLTTNVDGYLRTDSAVFKAIADPDRLRLAGDRIFLKE